MTIAALLVASALSAGNAEFDRTAAEGAWIVTTERFAREIAEKGPEPGSLKSAMLADPAAHKSREESERKCRELYAAAARKAYADKAEETRKRLGLDERSVAGLDRDPLDAKAIEAKFPSAFDAERRAAVEEQAKGLATVIRPTEAEFEEKSMDDLRREMTERVVREQKTAVFDENRNYVTTALVEPVLASGTEERSRQIEFLRHAKSEGAAPSAIAAELRSRLEKSVDERAKTAEPSRAWGVFPSVVKDALPKTAERRALKSFADRMSDVELAVTTNRVLEAVAADPKLHFRSDDSEKAFTKDAVKTVIAEACGMACADAPEAQREELGRFLEKNFEDDGIMKAAERQVRRDAVPKWRRARAELAELLAAQTWPTLADGTWYPDPDTADEVAARSDWKKAVGEWRRIPALERLAAADALGNLVEESAKAADAKVAAAFDLARSAIATQSAIVDEVQPAILADSRERRESFFRRTPDLAAITARLTAATEEKWGERRLATLWPDGAMPANAEEQHADLFPSVRRKIELVARQILEEMEKPEDESKPEESDTEGEPEEMLIVISAKRTATGYELELKRGETTIATERVPQRKDDFIQGMKRLAEKLLPLL